MMWIICRVLASIGLVKHHHDYQMQRSRTFFVFFQVEKIAASEHVVGLEEDDVQQDLPPSGLSSPTGIT